MNHSIGCVAFAIISSYVTNAAPILCFCPERSIGGDCSQAATPHRVSANPSQPLGTSGGENRACSTPRTSFLGCCIRIQRT